MHSRIFQISKMWIEKENYLNEDTLQQEMAVSMTIVRR